MSTPLCSNCKYSSIENVTGRDGKKIQAPGGTFQKAYFCLAPQRPRSPLDGSSIAFSCEIMRGMNPEMQKQLPTWMTFCGYAGAWWEEKSNIHLLHNPTAQPITGA